MADFVNEVFNTERELGWDDEITKDPGEFILLPDGDYNFTVKQVERARHTGSEKLPPCNKAVVHLEIEIEEGIAVIKHNLFLHTKTEGMLSSFFLGIGQKKKSEPLRMNWANVPGSKGRCKIGMNTWVNDKGETLEKNEVKKFYSKEDLEEGQPSFKPGKF